MSPRCRYVITSLLFEILFKIKNTRQGTIFIDASFSSQARIREMQCVRTLLGHNRGVTSLASEEFFF
jgi:hypothetical protein